MKLSDKLLVVAEWLESENNELLAETSDELVDSVALSLVVAAETLRDAAEEIKSNEAAPATEITPATLEEMAAVAEAFDQSGDDVLVRQASVLDEILSTIGAPKDYIFNFKKAEQAKLDALKKKYKGVKEELDEQIGTKEAIKAIEASPAYKEREKSRLEFALSARTCPDHAAPLSRVGEDEWQCSLDHKIYDFANGFTMLDGTKVPGGSVADQTNMEANNSVVFDSRDERLGIYRQ